MKNKKKKLTIIIICVLALLLIVGGVTFAYYMVTSNNNTTTIQYKGHSEKVGNVLLSNWDNTFNLDFNSEDMSKENVGVYYASNNTKNKYVKNEADGTYKFAKLEVKNSENDTNYYCTLNIDVTVKGSMKSALESGDFQLLLKGGSLNTRLDLYDIKESGKKTYTISFNLEGNETRYIETYLKLKNKSLNQDYLKNKDLDVEVEANTLNCEIVNKAYVAIVSTAENDYKGNIASMFENSENIKTAQFVKYVDEGITITNNTINTDSSIIEAYDLSENKDNSVIGWLKVNDEEQDKYDLYIGSQSRIYSKDFSSSFGGLTNLESIIFDNLDTSEVTTMSGMFAGCLKLKSIDLSKFDTSNVTNIGGMFNNNTSFTNISGLNELNTEKISLLGGMISGAKITSIDMSGWDLSSLTGGFGGMFTNCPNLTKVKMTDIKINNSNGFGGMFGGSTKLEQIDLSNWDASTITSLTGSFGGIASGTNESVKLIAKNWDVSSATNLSGLFSGSSLASIDASGWFTQNVTAILGAFGSNSNLVELNLSGWNTNKVTSMSGLFSELSKLSSLDLTGWDTPNVTNMAGMFYGCSSLTSIALNEWNTSSVTNLGSLFYDCNNLISIDLSNWNVSNVTATGLMFSGCNNLISINLEGWNLNSIKSLSNMFSNINNLTTLNLNGWKIPNETSLSELFNGLSSLTVVNVNGWDATNITSIYQMFANCPNLREVNMNNWKINNKLSFSGIFRGDTSLETINMNNWDASSLTDMTGFLSGLAYLSSSNVKLNARDWNASNVGTLNGILSGSQISLIDLSGWNIQNVTDMSGSFCNNEYLIEVNLSGWNIQNIINMRGMISDTNNNVTIKVKDTEEKSLMEEKLKENGITNGKVEIA